MWAGVQIGDPKKKGQSSLLSLPNEEAKGTLHTHTHTPCHAIPSTTGWVGVNIGGDKSQLSFRPRRVPFTQPMPVPPAQPRPGSLDTGGGQPAETLVELGHQQGHVPGERQKRLRASLQSDAIRLGPRASTETSREMPQTKFRRAVKEI